MSALHEAIYAHLAADGGVAALVGTRIGKGRAQEDDDLPYVVFFEVSANSETGLAGAIGFATKRIQINSVARTYTAAHALAAAVFTAVNGTKGTLGAGGVTIDCKAFIFAGGRDDPTTPPRGDRPGSDEGIHTVQADYMVSHAE